MREEDETNIYDELQKRAQESDTPMPDFVKEILKENLDRSSVSSSTSTSKTSASRSSIRGLGCVRPRSHLGGV